MLSISELKEELAKLSDAQEETFGGFLIPNDVPIKDVEEAFRNAWIEVIEADFEAELDFITGADVGPVAGCLNFVPETEVGDEKTKA